MTNQKIYLSQTFKKTLPLNNMIGGLDNRFQEGLDTSYETSLLPKSWCEEKREKLFKTIKDAIDNPSNFDPYHLLGLIINAGQLSNVEAKLENNQAEKSAKQVNIIDYIPEESKQEFTFDGLLFGGKEIDIHNITFKQLLNVVETQLNDKDPSVQKFGVANQGTLKVLRRTFSQELYMCIKKLLENELNYKEAHYAIKPESLDFTFSLDENSYPYVSNIKFKSIKASDKSTTTKVYNNKKTIFTQEDRDWEIRWYDRKIYRGGSKPAEQPRRLNLGDIFSLKKNDNDPKTLFYYELKQKTLTQIESLINTELNQKKEAIPFILKSHGSIKSFLESLNAYMLDKKEKEAKYAAMDTTNKQSFFNRCLKSSQSDKA